MEEDFTTEFPGIYRRAYATAYVILGSREEAEDVAAEVAARAFARWGVVRSYVEPWAVRVAGNLSIDRVRRLRRARPEPQLPASMPMFERVDLQRALLRLPRRQREAVVLRFIGDLSEADVASILGLSSGTVKSHTSRGIASLRAHLGGQA